MRLFWKISSRAGTSERPEKLGLSTAVSSWWRESEQPLPLSDQASSSPACFTSADTNVDNMDVDLDKEFLQGLKELKVLISDKDLLDMHKRYF